MKESTNAITWNIDSMTRMTSREIADLTGKRHPDVSRDIKTMLSELGVDVSKSARIYLDGMNRQQTEYVLDQELSTIYAQASTLFRVLFCACFNQWLYIIKI